MDNKKSFRFKEIKADKGTGSAIIAELNVVDLDGDVTLPGAFGTQEVNVLPAHDTYMPRLGKAILREADNYAIADFKFNLDPNAQSAKEWYSALKFDMENGTPLQEWSYGYDVLESEFGEFDGQKVRFLKSLKVHEISPVLKGAGVGTGTLSIKSGTEKMTYNEEQENTFNALNAIKRFIVRTKSLNDLKAQKGQRMNDDNIKSVEKVLAELTYCQGELSGLMSLFDTKDFDPNNAYAEFLETQFKLQGVLK